MMANLLTKGKQPEPPKDMVQNMDGRLEDNRINLPQTMPQATAHAVIELPKIMQNEADELRSRWNDLQARFVDEPHTTVEQGDQLVAEAFDRIMHGLADQQAILRQTWVDHENISTEDLRIALQKYRSFLNQLLEV